MLSNGQVSRLRFLNDKIKDCKNMLGYYERCLTDLAKKQTLTKEQEEQKVHLVRKKQRLEKEIEKLQHEKEDTVDI